MEDVREEDTSGAYCCGAGLRGRGCLHDEAREAATEFRTGNTEQATPSISSAVTATNVATVAPQDVSINKMRPRLVDLGAGKCIPCKMMAPILDELSKEYKAGEEYGVRMIPTQIFYDAAGNELFRHEGFFGKDEILGKWKEYGVAVSAETKE